ncbi:PREDICTED: uncharacterized protein LOC104599225 [Nelumbo nucifera]|uniref:Uncharacterized protein LOC104599225 n=2 Tax=Nelumbo nucifera TaxID=4432 RepID=A0A1U8A543_NELNU|nr:PREDICTED: uncharacterized protein LOC104599225 [Nelumbo nucifera]DAD35045.1 TPA_asm: hypothetical protein HUJ06_005685 [Nelumbo nucifera]
MDLWVVAAAAGAGYLAKYWQSLTKDREGLSQLLAGDSLHEKFQSQPLLQQLRDRTNNLYRLDQRQSSEDISNGKEEFSSNSDWRFPETSRLGGASATEMASTGGFYEAANFGGYDGYNLLSLSSLPLGISNMHHQKNEDGFKGKSEIGDKSDSFLSSELSTADVNFGSRYSRSRRLRSKWSFGYSIKPLSSLESCLIAQLYKEHIEREECTFRRPSRRKSTVRPLVVTDGSRIISRASGEYYSMRPESEANKVHEKGGVYSEKEKNVLGVPSLPEIGSVELPKKDKQKRGKDWIGRYGSSNLKISPRSFHSDGSPNGMLPFCIGITIGVMSTIIANKREVDKLKDLLKQTENLVQDLQEELEMKDLLTVKELTSDGYESQETKDICFHYQAPASPPEHKLDEYVGCDTIESHHQKFDENLDSMSKIEAELEAELERLELNMNASSLQRSFEELDPDFVGGIIHGELKAELVNGGARDQVDSDRDVSGTSTQTQTANYAVSPRELSLRLHEVIQERLEERIMELGTALQQSQKRVHVMESEQINWRREFNSEIGSSSALESPAMVEEHANIARPLVLNLSGEALDAYNEAYEELMRIDEPEESISSLEHKSNKVEQEGLYPFGQSPYWCPNGCGEYESISDYKVIEESQSWSSVRHKVRTWEELISRSQGSNEACESENEEDDEMEKLLIKQIVEKARQGSSVVLNAQKMLFSMDENHQ